MLEALIIQGALFPGLRELLYLNRKLCGTRDSPEQRSAILEWVDTGGRPSKSLLKTSRTNRLQMPIKGDDTEISHASNRRKKLLVPALRLERRFPPAGKEPVEVYVVMIIITMCSSRSGGSVGGPPSAGMYRPMKS